jgi:hypothetical protein
MHLNVHKIIQYIMSVSISKLEAVSLSFLIRNFYGNNQSSIWIFSQTAFNLDAI